MECKTRKVCLVSHKDLIEKLGLPKGKIVMTWESIDDIEFTIEVED